MLLAMTDAYRTSAFTCPTCPNAALREFQDRLVCDECAGMLIAEDDLVASIHELDGSADKLEVGDAKPSEIRCPRCRSAMTSCTLQLGTLALAGRYLRCATDGLWFPRDAMTAVFARVSRRGGFRGLGTGGAASTSNRGPASSGNAMVGNMPSGHGGMSGVMAGITNAFGGGAPASSGLAIGNWEHRRPRVHTLFVSAHKDRRLGCPSCKETALDYQGDRWACATCSGSFVENAALEAMIVEMSQKPWAMPAGSFGAPGERACPICKAAMIVQVLEAVTIDRCAKHGVWFDDKELQDALHHAGEPLGIGGWLKQLFHRHGTTE